MADVPKSYLTNHLHRLASQTASEELMRYSYDVLMGWIKNLREEPRPNFKKDFEGDLEALYRCRVLNEMSIPGTAHYHTCLESDIESFYSSQNKDEEVSVRDQVTETEVVHWVHYLFYGNTAEYNLAHDRLIDWSHTFVCASSEETTADVKFRQDVAKYLKLRKGPPFSAQDLALARELNRSIRKFISSVFHEKRSSPQNDGPTISEVRGWLAKLTWTVHKDVIPSSHRKLQDWLFSLESIATADFEQVIQDIYQIQSPDLPATSSYNDLKRLHKAAEAFIVSVFETKSAAREINEMGKDHTSRPWRDVIIHGSSSNYDYRIEGIEKMEERTHAYEINSLEERVNTRIIECDQWLERAKTYQERRTHLIIAALVQAQESGSWTLPVNGLNGHGHTTEHDFNQTLGTAPNYYHDISSKIEEVESTQHHLKDQQDWLNALEGQSVELTEHEYNVFKTLGRKLPSIPEFENTDTQE